ncbi:YdbL family protein [Sphingobium sp. AP49]|uniref:YdbL family protein n=1 Tax=Sphingobium sp. AP49 TaxID=1144307 RepID=UPI00026EE7C9|nr:YdbL family protein [Sphingobium sp. AP49]WHO40687.1 YdbL family protein [Sphingobium sp. AP49]
MTRKLMFAAALLGGLAMAGAAQAQSAAAAAIAAGTVGEQADGYLGIAGTVSADVRADVESINIKRRAAYTDLAGKRGVTVQDVAAATGCQTLSSRVRQGQAYRIGGGGWQTKGAGPIALPAYCATAGQ